MASMNKLSIRGVRAFNPEDKEQVVEFYCPMTFIVGANGCGKTTIIECLKYAITGSFPPGCGRGSSFVHDAKAIGQTVVKANVKLRFTSRSSQSMVVVRSMELQQKKAKSTFKQLDGVLRMMDPDTGEKVSLSHKCSELDKEIPQLLGVSRAILEHVILCHQEESSWPLMEGAVLKKRFDDIFDSTKYTKALKVFRDTEKEFNGKVKDLKADLAGLAAHKQAAEGFRQELAGQNELMEGIDEQKQEVSEKIAQSEERIQRLNEIIEKMDDLEILANDRKKELETHEFSVNKQLSILENDLTKKHSPIDLKEMMSNFRSKMCEQQNQLDELKRQRRELNIEIEKGRQEEKDQTSNFGKLTAEKEAHERLLKERYHKMEEVAQKYSLDMTTMSQSQSQTQNASFLAASLSQAVSIADSADGEDETVLTIQVEEMNAFFQTLESKESRLRSDVKETRDRHQKEEDKITVAITELGGKEQAIENDKHRLHEEKRKLKQELKELNDAATGYSRTRKTDVEDARRNAIRMAQEREQAHDDPRRTQIPLQIRQIEDKMDHLKRKIEDENIVLEALKQTTESQNALISLREQCAKEFEALEENIHDEEYTLTKQNIVVPKSLPKDDDEDGENLAKVIETMSNDARDKYDAANIFFRNASDEAVKSQKIVSEKTALLANCQRSLNTVKSKLQIATGSIHEIRKVLNDVSEGVVALKEESFPMTVAQEAPREILAFIDKRLSDVEENKDSIPAMFVNKILKKIRKMAKVKGDTEESTKIVCPCCQRDMNPDEVGTFKIGTSALEEALVEHYSSRGEEANQLKVLYQKARKAVETHFDDFNDFRRLTSEEADLEKESKKLHDEITGFTIKLKDHLDEKEEAQNQVDECRLAIDLTRRWSDDANRIIQKKMQIHQKKLDLSAATTVDTSRDLKTVDQAVTKLREDKESFSSKIAELNKEMTSLNRKISEKTQTAERSEKLARDKEERYATEMKATVRKQELQKRLQEIGEEESQLTDKIAPIKQRLMKKISEKDRIRAHANDEEQDLVATLSAFESDVKALRTIAKQIDAYENSTKAKELERISGKVSTIVARIEAKKREQRELEPKLEAVQRAVEDQERYRKNLEHNIDILETRDRMKDLEKEIEEIESNRSSIKGSDTAYEEFKRVKAKKDKLLQRQALLDGQYFSTNEHIRALKRKLQGEDYRGVDEKHRISKIKHETTRLAALDLKKYGDAMDRALLQFHGVKIREINQIIRELWSLTYKGQDITSIEIQSGMEPGLKAAKSYNYRVVMTKGGADIDMRGRCSAGQRVLASIVIRLALAETFGVNCGCIALDEPTVNLDYDNKKGLAVALAHIVESRSIQRNFQLILITHDEEFVNIMKTELSTMTGFSMPEKYFQVSRKEGSDGKYYSKINAVDWDELV